VRGRYVISNSAAPSGDPAQSLKKSGSRTAGAGLPLLGSNQDSPDPEGPL